MPAALTLTGERTLPGIPAENYWFRRHEAAYLALAPFVRGATVLEAGCGEGYGAALLARTARRVLALDTDPAAITHAAATYPQTDAVRADLGRLPFADGSLDVVANLQVIEHLADQEGFLAECARVLRPAGTLLVTTPNRLTFSPGKGPHDRPLNPFHTRELTAAELVPMIEKHFTPTRVLGIGHGPRLRRYERRHGPLVDAQLATPPAGWPERLRRQVERVRAADFAVSRQDVDAGLDLAVVAYRRP